MELISDFRGFCDHLLCTEPDRARLHSCHFGLPPPNQRGSMTLDKLRGVCIKAHPGTYCISPASPLCIVFSPSYLSLQIFFASNYLSPDLFWEIQAATSAPHSCNTERVWPGVFLCLSFLYCFSLTLCFTLDLLNLRPDQASDILITTLNPDSVCTSFKC